MLVEAREATSDDLATVEAFVGQAILELRSRRGGVIWAELHARTRPYLDSLRVDLEARRHALLVGSIDGTPVGYASATPWALHEGGELGRIDEIYVLPEARGVGVGEALMTALEGWGTELGLIGLDSIALPGDRATKNFFETFGLVARAIEVHRPLGS